MAAGLGSGRFAAPPRSAVDFLSTPHRIWRSVSAFALQARVFSMEIEF
jgi:hypothetical protein